MAAKGSIAKQEIIKRLQKAFGADFIGEVDKKVYLWADDGGSKVQIAIAMTCPKTFIDAPAPEDEIPKELDFSDDYNSTASPVPTKKIVITPEEEARISSLMEKLNL